MSKKEEKAKIVFDSIFECRSCILKDTCAINGGNEDPSTIDCDGAVFLDAFKSGWDEALRNQFCKCVNNKPEKGKEPKDGENVILLCQMVGGSNDGFIFPKVNTYKNGDWESKMLMRYNVIAWMSIPSFDEILMMNKDVLQRLKDN